MAQPSLNRSPLLPGEASTVVSTVAGLFGINGALTVLLMVYAVGVTVLNANARTPTPAQIIGFGVGALIGIGYCLTAKWLYDGRRRGAYVAIGVESLGLLSRLTAAERPSMMSVVLSVLMMVAVAFAWPYLSAAGREIDPPTRLVPRKRV